MTCKLYLRMLFFYHLLKFFYMPKQMLCIYIGLCVFSHGLMGQNQKVVDSLNSVLATKTGGARYSPLYELAFEYLDKDNERALEFVTRAEEAALLSGDSLWIVKSMRVKGQILSKLQRTDESVRLFERSVGIASRNNFRREALRISNSLGIADLFRGQFDKALVSFVRCVELCKMERDSVMLAFALNNIGTTYYKLHDFRKALNYYFKALDARAGTKQRIDLDTYVNVSLCYCYLEEFSKAEVYLKKSIQECSNAYSEYKMMHIKLASGMIYSGLNDDDAAMADFFSSLSYARRINEPRMILDNIANLSEILISRNEVEEAEALLKQAEEVIENDVPYPQTIVSVYSSFCHLYSKTNDYRKLALYQSKYIHLKDSTYNYELTARLMSAEAEFRQHQNQAKIESQNEIILLKEEAITRQQRLNLITGLLGVITLVFSIFLFLNFRRKKRLNILLEQKIRERTLELELSRDELLKVIREKDAKIYRATGMIADSVNTIEGLCVTARKEISDPMTHSYLGRIIKTSGAIATNLQTVFQDAVFSPSA